MLSRIIVLSATILPPCLAFLGPPRDLNGILFRVPPGFTGPDAYADLSSNLDMELYRIALLRREASFRGFSGRFSLFRCRARWPADPPTPGPSVASFAGEGDRAARWAMVQPAANSSGGDWRAGKIGVPQVPQKACRRLLPLSAS